MIDIVDIRKAQESDKLTIAHIIAKGFEREFSFLSKDMNKVAKALFNGIQIDRFYVAQQETQVIGVAACTDNTGRAVYPKWLDLCSNLGFIKGLMFYYSLKNEFMQPLSYSSNIGFIEFVTVVHNARRKGVAKILLKGIIDQSQYTEFVLDVTDINDYAIKAYTTFGFVETHRITAKHPKYQGYNEKVFMRYTPIS